MPQFSKVITQRSLAEASPPTIVILCPTLGVILRLKHAKSELWHLILAAITVVDRTSTAIIDIVLKKTDLIFDEWTPLSCEALYQRATATTRNPLLSRVSSGRRPSRA